MENLHLLAAASVYLLGLVCFLGYILQEMGWRRGKKFRKSKQRVFYAIWFWSLLCMAVVNWAEGLPPAMMLIWGLALFFMAWFINEWLFRFAYSVWRRRSRRR